MYAIIHEGKSIDKSFFELLLKNIGLDKNLVNFYGMGGKSNFFKKKNFRYKDLKLDIEREKIKKILFIIDSDYLENDAKYGGYKNSLREIESIQNELNIKNVSDTFIAYDRNSEEKEGYLESLILSSLPQEQKNCIEDFLSCSDFRAKTHDKSIFNILYKNGYPKAPYNFEHQNFDELKTKLIKLFEEI